MQFGGIFFLSCKTIENWIYWLKSKKYYSKIHHPLSSPVSMKTSGIYEERPPTKLIFPTTKWAGMYMKLTPTTCRICDVTNETYVACFPFSIFRWILSWESALFWSVACLAEAKVCCRNKWKYWRWNLTRIKYAPNFWIN